MRKTQKNRLKAKHLNILSLPGLLQENIVFVASGLKKNYLEFGTFKRMEIITFSSGIPNYTHATCQELLSKKSIHYFEDLNWELIEQLE